MASGRSSSLPPGDLGNPFWSERTKMRLQLAAARPQDLPIPSDDDLEDRQPLERGRAGTSGGEEAGQVENIQTGGSRTSFATPLRAPTSWIGVHGNTAAGGATEFKLKTEGPAPSEEQEHGLEKGLSQLMYEQLRDENEQLRDELEGLKRKFETGEMKSSTTSWSEVSGDEPHPCPPPPKTPRVEGFGVSGEDLRFTPGGTRVPPGRPTEAVEAPLPPLPPWPHYVSPIDAYQQVQETFDRGKHGDPTPAWMREDPRVPTPDQARMLWLEREVQALGKALRTQANGKWDEMYWKKPVHRWPQVEGQECVDAAFREVLHQDRASAVHGDLPHHGRASTVYEDLPHHGRASAVHGDLPHQGRAGTVHGELPQQDRASTVHGGLPHQGRASTEHGELLHQDRASTVLGGLSHQDRASKEHGELSQQDRAGMGHGGALASEEKPQEQRDGGALLHGRGQGQGLCAGQGHGHDQERERVPQYPGSEQSGQGSKLELPALPQETTPMDLGDWLTLITPSMKDIANNASFWWECTLAEATRFYDQWRQSTPLQRVQLKPSLPVELTTGQFERTEQRGVGLLLRALPSEMRNVIISNRDMASTAILWRLLITFQPGGNGEKGQLLKVLTTSSTASTASQLASHLRQWRRCFTRAREIGAGVPDGTLMVYALESSAMALGKMDGQAAFRIASSRAQLGVDEKPEAETVLLYSQVLLAEAETLTLSGTPSTTSVPTSTPKVKALQSQLGKGSPQTMASGTICKFWGSENGCRFGKQCKFAHPEITGADGQKRCWICSATTHRKMECPNRNSESTNQQPETLAGGSGDSSGTGGKGKGSKSSNKNGNGKSGKGDGKAKTETGVAGKDTPVVNKVTATAAEEAAAVDGQGHKKQDAGSGEAPATDSLMSEVTSLLKSLRVATQGSPQIRAYRVRSAGLKEGGAGERVLLDGGATHCLRQPSGKREWEESVPVQVQLASGQTEMRIHPRSNSLLTSQQVQNIIPLSKITELGYEVRWQKAGCVIEHPVRGVVPLELQQGCPTVDEQWGMKLMAEVESAEESRAALRKVLLGQQLPSTSKEEAVRRVQQLFPEAPISVLERIPGKSDWNGHNLPFNRRKRRQIEQAKTLVVHLFAGKEDPRWSQLQRDDLTVLNLDVLNGCDLMDDDVAGYLEDLAKQGKVTVWLAGPPCRTVSWLRHKGGDNGPPPLRGRTEEWRYGLPGLSEVLQAQVNTDSALWLRTLYWFYLSHCSGSPTKYFLEQPLDPEQWIKEEDVPEFGAPSFTVWPETEWMVKQLGLKESRIDQGALGHPVRKPTCLLSNIEEIVELNGLSCDSYDPSAWDIPLSQRIEKSKGLGAWAGGLKEILCRAINRVHHGDPPALRVLTAKEKGEVQAWIEHHRAGHLPFRKDCPPCLLGAGKNRQHRRLACPSSYVLTIDIVGPFTPGVDQEINAPRYGLVAVYSVPVSGEGVPLPEGLTELRNQSNQREQVDDIDFEEPQPEQPRGAWELDPEPEEQLPEVEVQQQEINEQKWKEYLKDRRAQPVRSLTFGVPLRSREASDVVSAVAQVYARARAMQLPITRIHSDRAREFSGGKFQKWCRDRDVFHTMTPGDEPQSNARAEREVAMVKQRMRIALRAANAPDHFWPLAFRFRMEQRHRQQLFTLGIQCPTLLPFGCRAVARRKTWHQRADPFKWPTLKVRLWGPASGMTASSNGYFVQDGEGKFFRTTVVYPHVDELKFQGEDDKDQQQAQGEEDRIQQQAQDDIGLEPGESLIPQPEEHPGSLPGGEKIEIEEVSDENRIDEKDEGGHQEQSFGHKSPGESEIKKHQGQQASRRLSTALMSSSKRQQVNTSWQLFHMINREEGIWRKLHRNLKVDNQ